MSGTAVTDFFPQDQHKKLPKPTQVYIYTHTKTRPTSKWTETKHEHPLLAKIFHGRYHSTLSRSLLPFGIRSLSATQGRVTDHAFEHSIYMYTVYKSE